MLRRALTAGGVAVAATGVAVSSGIALPGRTTGDPAAASLVADGAVAHPATVSQNRAADALALRDRTRAVSRSADRTAVHPSERKTGRKPAARVGHTAASASHDPRTIAKGLLGKFGFGSDQFSCLDAIYSQESGWDVHADNPSSSAYGIPQALPGSKMASAGPNWADDPATQIRWGLGYIKGRYGTPCNAWDFKQSNGWY